MFLKRLDAIASGVFTITIGGLLLSIMGGMFWENWEQAKRQQEVSGIVVAQEMTKVCRERPHRATKCSRWGQKQCPVVQYQPQLGELLKLKDCSWHLSMGEQVYVVYDSAVPTDARVALNQGTTNHWNDVLFTGIPVGIGGLLVGMGAYKVWQGVQSRA